MTYYKRNPEILQAVQIRDSNREELSRLPKTCVTILTTGTADTVTGAVVHHDTSDPYATKRGRIGDWIVYTSPEEHRILSNSFFRRRYQKLGTTTYKKLYNENGGRNTYV